MEQRMEITRKQKLRRRELLGAAARCFLRTGYDGAAMRDIAREAGMKAGSLYYHFPSKEALYFAVYEEGVGQITSRVSQAVENCQGSWQRLEAACAAHLAVLLEGGEVSRVLRQELPLRPVSLRRQLIMVRDGYEVIFTRLIGELDLPGESDRHELRLMLIGALNYAHTWYRKKRDSPDVIAGNFLRFLREPLDGKARNQGEAAC